MTPPSDGELRLRPWRASDRPALEALMCDPIAMEHTGGALTRDEAGELLEVYVAGGKDELLAVYAVEHRGEVVGSVDVLSFSDGSLEIGYALLRSHWRRGLGARAARLVLGVARRMARPGQRIVALVDHGHDASIGVLERIGLRPAGTYDDPDDGEVLLYAAPELENELVAAE